MCFCVFFHLYCLYMCVMLLLGIINEQGAKVIWQRLHRMTPYSEAELIEPRDRQTDTLTDRLHARR